MTDKGAHEIAEAIYRVATAINTFTETLNDEQFGRALEGLAALQYLPSSEVALAVHALADALETHK